MKSATSTEAVSVSAENGVAVRSSDMVIPRLVNLLKDPAEEWTFGDHTARNVKRGIEIWTSNMPVLDTNTYPTTMSMGILDKWRVWRALKTARNNYWLRKLNEHQKPPYEARDFRFPEGGVAVGCTDGLDGILQGFVRKHAIVVEELTEKQVASALRQAIECGDFTRQVRVTDNAQNIIYIPYMREQELESRIRRLEAALKQNGTEDPDVCDAV